MLLKKNQSVWHFHEIASLRIHLPSYLFAIIIKIIINVNVSQSKKYIEVRDREWNNIKKIDNGPIQEAITRNLGTEYYYRHIKTSLKIL